MTYEIGFNLDIHFLVGQGVWAEVDTKLLVWVVEVLQRDHVLDPEEQSVQDKGECCWDNTETVPFRPHAT